MEAAVENFDSDLPSRSSCRWITIRRDGRPRIYVPRESKYLKLIIASLHKSESLRENFVSCSDRVSRRPYVPVLLCQGIIPEVCRLKLLGSRLPPGSTYALRSVTTTWVPPITTAESSPHAAAVNQERPNFFFPVLAHRSFCMDN